MIWYMWKHYQLYLEKGHMKMISVFWLQNLVASKMYQMYLFITICLKLYKI